MAFGTGNDVNTVPAPEISSSRDPRKSLALPVRYFPLLLDLTLYLTVVCSREKNDYFESLGFS